MVLWRPTRPFRTNTPKRCPFPYRGLECKTRKSRNTWSNRQIWPCSTEWSRAKANRVLPKECTGHSKYHLPTTQEKTLYMDITRWSILKSDWLSLQPKWEVKVKLLNHVWLLMTPWTVAYQIHSSMGLSRQEYRTGLPFLSSGDLPNPGIKPRSPVLQVDSLPSEPPGKSYWNQIDHILCSWRCRSQQK